MKKKYVKFQNDFDNILFENSSKTFICIFENKNVLLELHTDHLTVVHNDDLIFEIFYNRIPMWKVNKKYIEIFINHDEFKTFYGDGKEIAKQLGFYCRKK